MIYKIKFELDYSNMNKGEVRDAKIDDILSEHQLLEMEIDPNINLNIPIIGSTIDIDNIEYKVTSSKFKMEPDCYSVIFLLTKAETLIKREMFYSRKSNKIPNSYKSGRDLYLQKNT